MKLQTVNVLEMSDGNILSLNAFSDDAEGNEEAESLYLKMVMENTSMTAEEVEEVTGFDSYSEDGYEVFIIHS